MEFLTDGILALTWQQIVMFAVGITLIWLAIKRDLNQPCFCQWALVPYL